MTRRPGRLVWCVAIVAAGALIPVVAYGAYVTRGSVSFDSRAETLPAPGKPMIATTNAGLSISWSGTALSTGRAVDGYQVWRTVGSTTSSICTTVALSCTDGRPTQAASYAVVAKLANWTATSSATTYVPDSTPPAITNLAISADTGASATDFVTDQATQQLTGKTEGGALVSVTYNGAASSVTADAAGSFAVDLTLTSGTRDATVTATDQAGNTGTVTQSITLTTAQPPVTPATSVIVAGNPETSMASIDWQIPQNPTSQFCVTTTLTGTSSSPKPWQLLIHLDKPPFYGAQANEIFYRGNSQVDVVAVPGDSTMARVTGSSSPGSPWNASWNNALLDSSRTLTVTLCDAQPRQPSQGDPSWYDVTVTPGAQSATQSCVRLTVTAKTSQTQNPFYFGWQAAVDLTAAKRQIEQGGRTVNYVNWSPDPSSGYQFTTSPATTKPVADTYELTSGRMTAVKAGGSTTIVGCVQAF